tara:strand:+ start:694 stop:984 length:291 start_codon:yes stop_codon:yes gene_type:complete
MKKLKKQLLEMQLKYNVLDKKYTNEARELQHSIEMTIKAIDVIQCCTQLRNEDEEKTWKTFFAGYIYRHRNSKLNREEIDLFHAETLYKIWKSVGA